MSGEGEDFAAALGDGFLDPNLGSEVIKLRIAEFRSWYLRRYTKNDCLRRPARKVRQINVRVEHEHAELIRWMSEQAGFSQSDLIVSAILRLAEEYPALPNERIAS